MSQTVGRAGTVHGMSRTSSWLAAVGFLLIALGTGILSWFPTYGALEFTLQALGPVLIAVALLIGWRTHAARWGWTAFIFFLVGILAYGVMWSAYAVDPNSLGNETATQRGFFTVGVGYLCAAIGMFVVIGRKQRQLTSAPRSGERAIAATFAPMWLCAIGALVCAAGGFIWLMSTDSKLQHFSLLIIGWALVVISAIASAKLMAARLGSPATVLVILAMFSYWLHYVLDALPSWMDADWRQSMHVSGAAFVFAAIAFVVMAARKNLSHQQMPAKILPDN